MTPSASFVADLARYDPALRVRWSRHQPHAVDEPRPVFLIERQMPERVRRYLYGRLMAHDTADLDPAKLSHARKLDLIEGLREGYDHVMSVHKDLLTWAQVEPVLAAADAYKRTHKSLADLLDEQDEQADAAQERSEASFIADRAYGLYDDVAWGAKRRVSVPVEVREGYVVQDHRAAARA